MQKVEFTSKFLLAVIAVTAISVGIGVQAYNIQAADAQAKLPNNSVRSETIVNGQVKKEDIADGVIQSGGTELNIHRVAGVAVTIPAGEGGFINVQCPDGEFLTGGGYDAPDNYVITRNFPTGITNWLVVAHNPAGGAFSMNAFALCLDPTP